jgi:putative transposase
MILTSTARSYYGPPSRGRFGSCCSLSCICCCAIYSGLMAGSSNEQLSTEVGLVVLRHQLMVLKRQVGRPRLRRRDRLFMAAISRALPRARWSSFLVTPQTLLRWHRELVRRKWTFRRRSAGGRPSIPDEVRELILRMGRENPRSAA